MRNKYAVIIGSIGIVLGGIAIVDMLCISIHLLSNVYIASGFFIGSIVFASGVISITNQ